MSNERMTDAALAICSNGIPDAERMLKELRELCDRSINAGGERYILPNTDRYLLIWAMDAITTADAALRARPQAVGELYCVGRTIHPEEETSGCNGMLSALLTFHIAHVYRKTESYFSCSPPASPPREVRREYRTRTSCRTYVRCARG